MATVSSPVEDSSGSSGSNNGGPSEPPDTPSPSTSSSSSSSTSSSSINLFQIPHSRMKELVDSRLKKVVALKSLLDGSSSNSGAVVEQLLQAVYEAMWELKSHEYIENTFIMDRLKARLQARRVYNQLVCNCHEDSKLLGVIHLVEQVYAAPSSSEREQFGRQLQAAITEFLDEFLHHMEEEEAVFQPLLDQNFEPGELRQMNEMVLKQHSLFREKVRAEKSLKAATATKRKRTDEGEGFECGLEDKLRFRKTYCQEVNDHFTGAGGKKKKEEERNGQQVENNNNASLATLPDTAPLVTPTPLVAPTPTPTPIAPSLSLSALPEELLSMVFSRLSPRDLLTLSCVNRRFRRVAFTKQLWRRLNPVQWADGLWTWSRSPADYDPPGRLAGGAYASLASSTESLNSQSSEVMGPPPTSTSTLSPSASERQRRVFRGLVRHLLPSVGSHVTHLDLSNASGLTSAQVRAMLNLCPGVRSLDLSYTSVSSQAFCGLTPDALASVEEINLEGCVRLNDAALKHLRKCFAKRPSRLRRLVLSGCRELTSHGLELLEAHQRSLEELDLSGCYKLDGETLRLFVQGCKRLKPQKLSYCNDIEDGPYPQEANGCLNLDCNLRFCCQNVLRN